jgi:hypothetical protein
MKFDRGQQAGADAAAAPLRQYVEMSHASGMWIVAIRITGEMTTVYRRGSRTR